MAYAVVQNAPIAINGGSGHSVTGTFSSPVGNGNTVIGVVQIGDNSTGITVVDNNSVSAPMVLEVRDSITTGSNYAVFVKTGVTGVSPTSWTATNVGGSTNSAMAIFLEEYSGFSAGAAVDGTPVGTPLASNTGANLESSGNTTTTNAGDLVWSFAVNSSGGANNSHGTTPAYTLNQNNPGGTFFFWSEWLTQAAAGAIAGTWQADATGTTVIVGVVAVTQGAAAASQTFYFNNVF